MVSTFFGFKPESTPSSCGASTFFERLVHVTAQRAQGRRDAKQHAGQARNEKGKCEYAPVH